MSMEGIGDFIEVNALNKSYYCKEVRKIIADQKRHYKIFCVNGKYGIQV